MYIRHDKHESSDLEHCVLAFLKKVNLYLLEIPAIIEVPPASPVAFSPRKSGRPLKSKRYGDEEWVTSSPRGRGRGRGSPRTESPTGFGSLR